MNETLVNGTTYVIYATMYTSKGNIELELFPQSAPKSVANFVNLAKSGFYDDLLFHRIVPGFVIQAGDPTTKETGISPEATLPHGVRTMVPSVFHWKLIRICTTRMGLLRLQTLVPLTVQGHNSTSTSQTIQTSMESTRSSARSSAG